MSSIIAHLWRGDIGSMQDPDCTSAEIKKLEELIRRNQIKLEDNLPEEKKHIAHKLYDCFDEHLALYTEQAFCNGFSLGLRICAQALLETEY